MLEPFYGGSHKQWIDGYKQHTQHEIELYTLPDTFWKWRMDGGAIEIAKQFLDREKNCDLFLGSDMLDANTFLSLVRKASPDISYYMYFHENQLSYPWSSQERHRDWKRRYYGMINYRSAVAADKCFFNSDFHMKSFLQDLEEELQRSPDYKTLWSIDALREKSSVLPLGMSVQYIYEYAKAWREESVEDASPLILWNHRWDYDKRPDKFFNVIRRLDEEGYNFRLAVLGEQLDVTNKIFEEARERFHERIEHWGYVESYEEYIKILSQCSILPVTSEHDFFGASVIEAVTCGVIPVLPRRLVYPEHFPELKYGELYYENTGDLLDKLRHLLKAANSLESSYAEHFLHLDWTMQVTGYDKIFGEILT